MWNVATGTEIRTLEGHSGEVNAVVLTADQVHIVSGSVDETIMVWLRETGEVVRTLAGHAAGIYSLALSSDQKLVVSGSGDQTIRIWNL